MNKKYYYRIKTTYTTEDQWTATILLCCKVKKRVVSEEVKTALGGFETQMAAEKGLSQQLKSFQESAAIAKAERAKIRLENRAKKIEHAMVLIRISIFHKISQSARLLAQVTAPRPKGRSF